MKLSVCMAVFNGEKFIKEQLDSILVQLGDADEVIISDDGSTDKTLSIIEGYDDTRIQIFHSGQKSIIKNFENSLINATGDVVFLSDQDDIWYPNKVVKVLTYIQSYDLVFSNASVFKENTNQSYLLYKGKITRTGFFKNFIKNNYIGATMAFKHDILKRALPFPDKIYMHDIWIALTAELMGRTYFIEQPLIYYRRHGNNASETDEKSSNSFVIKFKMRFNLALSLFRRFL